MFLADWTSTMLFLFSWPPLSVTPVFSTSALGMDPEDSKWSRTMGITEECKS